MSNVRAWPPALCQDFKEDGVFQMTKSTIPIPDGLRDVVSDLTLHKKNLVIHLGEEYNRGKIIVTIDHQFSKLKIAVMKELSEKGVDRQDIIKITSLIQDNYQAIYPDDDSDCSSDPNKEESTFAKLDITHKEWLATLNEKYGTLKDLWDKNFPGLWHTAEFALSVKNILHIKDITLPFIGIVLGPPSSSKTLVLEMLRGIRTTFYTDSFTPKSFVSHNTSVKEKQLQQIDMLPKLKNKVFITPELAPVFSAKDEDLLANLAVFTRLADGHGYECDSGAYGHRGYNEDIMFTWLGAAVDIPRKVYRHLGTLGPKLYFYRMNKTKRSDNEYLKLLKENDFHNRNKVVKDSLQDYIAWFEQCPTGECDASNKSMKIIEWDSSKDDDDACRMIVLIGRLLSNLRGVTTTWETKDTQGSDYAYSTPIIEDPSRAIISLANLSKGHASLTGRNHITIDDIPILIKVVLSTAPIERVMVFDLLLNHNGELTTSKITDSLNISRPTAIKTMRELEVLGLVDSHEPNFENEPISIGLKNDFEWFLSEQFKRLRGEFIPEGKSKYDKDEDGIKKNTPHTEQKKSTEDIIPECPPPMQSQLQPALIENGEEVEEKQSETNDNLDLDNCQSKAVEADGHKEKLPLTSNVMDNHKEITSEEYDDPSVESGGNSPGGSSDIRREQETLVDAKDNPSIQPRLSDYAPSPLTQMQPLRDILIAYFSQRALKNKQQGGG
jgi:hypothetical protein